MRAARETDGDNGPSEQDKSCEQLRLSVNFERHGGLVAVLGPSDRRIVVADQKRLARLGQKPRGEE